MCQANIRKQAAQIALKKIVLLLNLKINLLLSIPVLLSVHQIFVQYLGLHILVKLSFLVGKEKKLEEIVGEEVLVLEQTGLR